MSLKPWREVVTPHEDVLHGTFQESEFAADLTKVVRGVASPEYQDPALFFQRTVITEGMGRLLESVIKRLTGEGGDPVMQLQTAFGGGKTHTMLAVYHVACGDAAPSALQGVPALLDHAGVSALPTGRVAVLDGNNLAPAQPREVEGAGGPLHLRTLWGELAYQLGAAEGGAAGGAEAYDMVRASDEAGTSPGKDVLVRLFERYAPCVVLIDEAVAYLRQFEPGKSYAGGTFDSNLSFFQALTEAATAVKTAMVLGSLPESIMEVGDQLGQRALDSLEKYFGRIEAVWKPVGTDEAFEIVRRRLFQSIGDDAARDAVCQGFADYYLAHPQDFPAEVQKADYVQRLRDTYPVHPEVFTRLYEDWSTLPKFQKTRGVLRLMARLIYRLWSDGNRDLLIMPGSFALYDRDVRTELVKYLPGANWDPIVERDVDGKGSVPSRLDDDNPALGQLQACRRAARTIFLGSAPSSSAQRVRGLGIERVRLGAAQPPQSPGRYSDAVRRLSDKLHYLYSGNDRYWYDTRPNLRREMEDRQQRFSEAATYLPEIQKRLEGLVRKGGVLGGVHVFRDDADVPDDHALRLVVLPPDVAHRRREGGAATERAADYLQHRGSQPRLNQNRLLFLAADADAVVQLRHHTRAFLAWDSIVGDAEQLNLDPYHQRQARENRQTAEARMMEALQQAYSWLLAPRQELSGKGELLPLSWDEERVDRGGRSFSESLQQAAVEAEMVIPRWAPVHLARILNSFYFDADGNAEGDGERGEVETTRLWDDMARYAYLPRLKDRAVLIATIEAGVQHEDFYGLASGRRRRRLPRARLRRGRAGVPHRGRAAPRARDGPRGGDARARAEAPAEAPTATGPVGGQTAEPGAAPIATGGDGATAPSAPRGPQSQAKVTQFYGATNLDPISAKGDFGTIVDEVVQHFTAKYGTEVTIRVEVQAERPSGFDEQVQRTVRANCGTLGFTSAEFEE